MTAPPKVIDLFDALKRSLEKPTTGTDMATAKPDPPMPTREAPPAPKQPRSGPDKYAQAGRVARRLEALDAAEAQALAEAPADISKRFQEKRAAVIREQTAEVQGLVERMRRGGAEDT